MSGAAGDEVPSAGGTGGGEKVVGRSGTTVGGAAGVIVVGRAPDAGATGVDAGTGGTAGSGGATGTLTGGSVSALVGITVGGWSLGAAGVRDGSTAAVVVGVGGAGGSFDGNMRRTAPMPAARLSTADAPIVSCRLLKRANNPAAV
jgi:hypothetical protein